VQTRLLSVRDLTPAERKYGRGVKPDRYVQYQPDVVVIANGPNVIRSGGADGFTWIIDAHAGRDLSVGKIAFVTERCVGRVLKLTQEGDHLALILAPVQLTDIFKELNVSLNQPIEMSEAVQLPALSIPQAKLPLEGDDAAPPDWAFTFERHAAAAYSALPEAAAVHPVAYYHALSVGIPPVNLDFKTRSLKTSDGPLIELAHEADGIRLIAQAQLRVKELQLEFYIDIHGGKMLEARVILHNTAGIRLAFDSAVGGAFSRNITWHLPAGGFSIPLSANVPLSLNIRQDIWVKSAFSARQSVYNTAADYDLNADVGFIFQGGKFSLVGPKGVSATNNVLNNMSGVSVGVNGLVLSHALTVTGGLGVWEFSTGPSFSLGSSLGASMGASEGIIQCKDATLSVNLRAGVGWTIPPVVARLINFFLRVVKVQEIPDHDGLYTPWTRLFVHYDRTKSPICGGSSAGTQQ
jgi:hypothetical protein